MKKRRASAMAGTMLALLLAAAWGILTPGAGVRKVSIESCARQADVVFVGTVVDIRTRWGEGGKLIWTDYLFKVHDTWKGAPGEVFRTVSVGGGTVGDKTFLLSEVPAFERGGTYVVYAYDNARLIAEAVVGVDQGLFREVTDAETGLRFLIDAHGYRMERLDNGCVVRGRLTRRVGDGQRAHVLTDAEAADQQEAFERESGPASIPPPVVRDAEGNILPTQAKPENAPREKALAQLREAPQGSPLTREDLRIFTLKELGLQEPAPASPRAGGPEGGK